MSEWVTLYIVDYLDKPHGTLRDKAKAELVSGKRVLVMGTDGRYIELTLDPQNIVRMVYPWKKER